MNKKDILNMPAGAELDALIAERVMGEPKPPMPHEHVDILRPVFSKNDNWYCLPDFYKGDECEWEPRPFSANIEAAWRVVEKLSERSAYVEVTLYDCGHNSCRLHPYKDIYVEADTAPLAICRAALLAVMETA